MTPVVAPDPLPEPEPEDEPEEEPGDEPASSSGIPAMSLIGSMNGDTWSSAIRMTYNSADDTWNVSAVVFEETDQFRFRVKDDWSWSYGTPAGGSLGQLTSNDGQNISGLSGTCSIKVTDTNVNDSLESQSFTYSCQ